MRAFIALAGEWLLAQKDPDAFIRYKYLPEKARYASGSNEVRKLGALWSITELARFTGDGRYAAFAHAGRSRPARGPQPARGGGDDEGCPAHGKWLSLAIFTNVAVVRPWEVLTAPSPSVILRANLFPLRPMPRHESRSRCSCSGEWLEEALLEVAAGGRAVQRGIQPDPLEPVLGQYKGAGGHGEGIDETEGASAAPPGVSAVSLSAARKGVKEDILRVALDRNRGSAEAHAADLGYMADDLGDK